MRDALYWDVNFEARPSADQLALYFKADVTDSARFLRFNDRPGAFAGVEVGSQWRLTVSTADPENAKPFDEAKASSKAK